MHLRGYPRIYTKDGEKRFVYYTAEAKDLREQGWKEQPKGTPEPEGPDEDPDAEPGDDESPDGEGETSEGETGDLKFEFMTKPELLEYALERGVDLPNNALKADLVKACQELPRD